MGVPHFTSSLRPYSERVNLNGTTVVIDGPALAYHIIYLCSQHLRTSGLYNQPTYAQLGETAVAWLDQLCESDITISAIFFDGYLPQSKRATRFDRYCRRSKSLNNYFLANATGVRKSSSNGRRDAAHPMPLFPQQLAHRDAELPPPAFSVPAIIEAIRRSQYGSITQVVPQEADLYCADHLRRLPGGGVILTSDSDLLVYDLGHDGAVAFFSDIEIGTLGDGSGPQALSVCRFSPSQICEHFKITHEYGLSTLAYEMSVDPWVGFKKLVERARKVPEIGSAPDEFWEFLTPYRLRLKELPAVCGQEELTRLDSCVSEFVLQCLQVESADDACDGEDGPGEERILVFLAQMPDKWSHTTAWEMSASIRQIAYSTMQLVAKRRIPVVNEYRRMISVTTQGKSIEISLQTAVQRSCSDLLTLLSRIQDGIDDSALHWITLAMHLDIEWSKKEGKESNVLNVLRKETTPAGTVDVTSWNVVHLWALIQGTYYSIRMLAQILGLASRQEDEAPDVLQELLRTVSTLPTFADWPDVETLRDLPDRMRQNGGLNMLQELSGLTEPIRFLAKDKSAKKQRVKGVVDKNKARNSSSSSSTNSFAALF